MKRLAHRIVVPALLILAALLGFMVWYWIHYSMQPAQSFEVRSAALGPKVLIATQGSAFKDAVVQDVVTTLKQADAHVKVIDVSALSDANAADWDAVVVIHTWEMRKPPPAVETFINGLPDTRKLIVLTTSGRGDFRMPGVDAISAASRMEDASARAAEISGRIATVLRESAGHGRQPPGNWSSRTHQP